MGMTKVRIMCMKRRYLMKTLRCVISVALLPLMLSAQQPAAEPLTNQRIMDLSRNGVRSDELAVIISTAPQISFDLSPSGTQQMMQAGVTEGTIKAMAAREAGVALRPAGNQFQPVSQYAASLQQPVTGKHSHRLRNWIIIGVAAGGLGYWGYRLSNPTITPAGCFNCGGTIINRGF
jgi:hypothetical protein